MRFHFIAHLRPKLAAILALACASLTLCLLASCSDRENRYDHAMALAKSYSMQNLPENLVATFGGNRTKDSADFSSVINHKSFEGRFKEVAAKVLKKTFVQDANAYLLKGILDSLSQRCFRTESGLANVDCGEDGIAYYAYALQLLHTNEGDFVYTTANFDRGNGASSNENASQLVLIVDPKDGSLGIIIEDKMAVSGGRPDLMAAILTLASSLTRVQANTPEGKKFYLNDIRYDLEAAKAGTLYSKPAEANTSQALPPDSSHISAASSAPSTELTKDELREIVLGKPPEEVRRLLGSPSNVSDTLDGLTWYYWADKLTVVDPVSGTTVTSSNIRFSTVNGLVREVSF